MAGGGRRRGRGGRRRAKRPMDRAGWLKLAVIALILYVAGILVPLGAFLFAVQRDVVLAAWGTGNVALVVLAVALAAALSLGYWLKRLAQRV